MFMVTGGFEPITNTLLQHYAYILNYNRHLKNIF